MRWLDKDYAILIFSAIVTTAVVFLLLTQPKSIRPIWTDSAKSRQFVPIKIEPPEKRNE